MSDATTVAAATPEVDVFVGSGVRYEDALRWQRDRVMLVRDGGREALALIEHSPVYSMGRRGGRASVLLPEAELRAPVVDVERGGDVTWHGPGQLVGYPILDLRARGIRVADYIRLLEAMVIEVLDGFGVHASTVAGRPGVWLDGAKIAAIGVAVRGGVAFHGFALNVAPDLSWYDPIVPCGLADATVTSIAEQLGEAPPASVVVDATSRAFERRFAARLVASDASSLRAEVLA